jgi:flagellar motor switch protein FliM
VEPILTKQEIAALLAAIKAGRVSTDLTETSQPWPPRQSAPVSGLDLFTVYERIRVSGERRIPNLDIILDSFAAKFSTSLTNAMLRKFSVERAAIATTAFHQSLVDLNNQGAVGIYHISPLKYGCLFHFDTTMAFTLLEIMLGSSQAAGSLTLDRDLTTIEMSLLKTVMTGIGNELAGAMRPILEIQARLTKVENNFRLVNIVEPDTEVLVTRFDLHLAGEFCGQMRFIVPCHVLEPLREKFKALVTITQESTPWTDQIAHEALEVESLAIARSGHVSMTIRKILNLKPGDIVDLQYNPDQPLTILIEDQPLFQAIAGERNGKKAFHVTGRHGNRLGGIHGST